MRFGHIELFVKDPMESRKFYENILGFELTEVQEDKFVWLKLGETEILLRPGDGMEKADDYAGSSSGIVFYTDNLPETSQKLAERGLEFGAPDGLENCMTFCDPDGHWFQLVNPAEQY